ncbi:MAG: exodeoxyribonuclease III [Solobacterium sp.]|nr:exodeoxyribonuclease III [Solobacterium sp.]MCH4206031.1 exodeoxyribonuclease III [Solobacterium sp.]MCH4227525.1 exodeoxyribonuclease III [Solobacterium sp.]MCH4282949.1 exodeoxyribonuclease III [Solobacterium sp.]
MKIISWNVNGLRACMSKGFADFFKAENADIFAVQETKMQPEQMSDEMKFAGYHLYMNSAERKGYSGTLVYAKKEPLNVTYEIEGDTVKEGRVITLEYPDFYFVCAYVPNSKEGLARLSFRMEWEELLKKHLCALDQKKPVIYTGDLNVAHEEIDIKNPASNHKNAGFSDEEREKMTQLLASGFQDTFRKLHPQEVKYSWWSYRFHAREKNAGWRIDYFLVSDRLMDQVQDSLIYDTVQGSDHCPVGLQVQL